MTRLQLLRAWIEENGKAIDQLGNTFVIGTVLLLWTVITGTPSRPSMADETISARTFRGAKNGRVIAKFFLPIFDFMFLWQSPEFVGANGEVQIIRSHCQRAYLKELHKRGLPDEYRTQGQPA